MGKSFDKYRSDKQAEREREKERRNKRNKRRIVIEKPQGNNNRKDDTKEYTY